jgi:hypothetical protein
LQSVHQILETLDDRAEHTTVQRAVQQPAQAASGVVRRLLRGAGSEDSVEGEAHDDVDDFYDDDDYYDEEDDVDYEGEGDENSQDYHGDNHGQEEDALAPPDEPEEEIDFDLAQSTYDKEEGSASPLESRRSSSSSSNNPGAQEATSDNGAAVTSQPPPAAPDDEDTSSVRKSLLPSNAPPVTVPSPDSFDPKTETVKETSDTVEATETPRSGDVSSSVSIGNQTTGGHTPHPLHVDSATTNQSVSPDVVSTRSTAGMTVVPKKTPPSTKTVPASLPPPLSNWNDADDAAHAVIHTQTAPRTMPSTTTPPQPPAHTALKRAAQQEHMARLTKQLQQVTVRAQVAEREVAAQHAELEAAAQRLQEDRELAAEEQEDLLEDHAEEMQTVKQTYEERLAQQQKDYEQRLVEANAQVKQVQAQRRREGGDLTSELQEGLDREREALQQVAELNELAAELEDKVETFQQQESDWQTQVASLQGTLHETTSRERKLEEQMDALKESHQKQLAQRQEREGQLEQNIAHLSAALSRQKEEWTDARARSSSTAPAGEDYKAKYQVAAEELVTCRGQLDWANQRSEALQSEISTLSAERLAEVEQVQGRQRHHDARVGQLQREIARLETALAVATPSDDVSKMNKSKLTASQQQVQSLSDQLMRQQNLSETSKSEVLALKGRLQAALSRAENAEQEAAAATSHHQHDSLELQAQSGNTSGWGTSVNANRRRKRGGRTMRSALGVRASSPIMLQVVQTVDALDLWMLETGNIFKQEPMARLGLLFYTLLLHAWCFGLIFFHAVESEHSDLGSLTARRAVLSGTHVVAGIP